MKRLLMSICLVFGSSQVLVRAEEIVLTTYIPSPRGVYSDLRAVNSMVIGSNATYPEVLHITAHPVGTPQDAVVRLVGIDAQFPIVMDRSGHLIIGDFSAEFPDPSNAHLKVLGPVVADAYRAFEASGRYAFMEGKPNDGWAAFGGGFALPGGGFTWATVGATFDSGIVALQSRSGGQLGILTHGPNASVTIAGTGSAIGTRMLSIYNGVGEIICGIGWCPAGSEILTVVKPGNLGLNQPLPTSTLQVVGGVLIALDNAPKPTVAPGELRVESGIGIQIQPPGAPLMSPLTVHGDGEMYTLWLDADGPGPLVPVGRNTWPGLDAVPVEAWQPVGVTACPPQTVVSGVNFLTQQVLCRQL